MAAGDASALGTVALIDKVGQSPADPTYVNRISVIGDADYKAGGTSGLLAALRALTKDTRVIVSAKHLYSVLAADGTAQTTVYVLHYDVAHNKIQAFITTAGAAALAEVADGTDRSTIKDIWEVVSK